jgi:hypothetical protein
MAKYRSNGSEVEAVQYTGQPVEGLPEWLQRRVEGVSGQGANARLLVEADGYAEHLQQGEWAVLFEGDDLEFLPDNVFQRQFSPVEG